MEEPSGRYEARVAIIERQRQKCNETQCLRDWLSATRSRSRIVWVHGRSDGGLFEFISFPFHDFRLFFGFESLSSWLASLLYVCMYVCMSLYMVPSASPSSLKSPPENSSSCWRRRDTRLVLPFFLRICPFLFFYFSPIPSFIRFLVVPFCMFIYFCSRLWQSGGSCLSFSFCRHVLRSKRVMSWSTKAKAKASDCPPQNRRWRKLLAMPAHAT